MQYVNGMSETYLDIVVKEVVDLLLPSIQMEVVNKHNHSVEKHYDNLGIDIIFNQVLGFPNMLSMMIIHPNYTVSYNKMWPAFDNNTIRITGTATIKYTGNCTPIQDLLTFLRLQQ